MTGAGIASLVILLLGGVGLFLLGMSFMTDGLKALAGNRLRDILSAWTSSAPRGLVAGIGLTALVQSSSAVVVATIGFVNAGLLTLREALWVVFGTNIGTTATGWIVALVGVKVDLQFVALPLLGVGVALRLFSRGEGSEAAGTTLAGFGLFFLGIELLKEGFTGVAAGFELTALPVEGWTARLAFLAVGLVLTVLTQSSSAGIAVTLTAAAAGAVPLDLAAAAVIGANLGTTSTALLATVGAQPAARRVAAGHVVFNLVTAALAIVILQPMLNAVEWLAERFDRDPTVPTLLALFNTAFNAVGVAIMAVVAAPLAGVLDRRFRTAEEDAARPAHVDETVLEVPEVAVASVRLDIRRLAGFSIGLASDSLRGGALPSLRARREAIHRLAAALLDFVARLNRQAVPEDVAGALPHYLRAIQHLQEIADLAVEQARFQSVPLPTALTDGLDEYTALVRQSFAAADAAFGAPARLDDAVAAAARVEASYQALKARILNAAASGEVPVAALGALIDRVNGGRRLADHAAKAARRLALAEAVGERRRAMDEGNRNRETEESIDG